MSAIAEGEFHQLMDMKRYIRRERRIARFRLVVFALPLILFVTVGFVLPVGVMLLKGFDNSVLHRLLAETNAALSRWDGKGLPGEVSFQALEDDIKRAVRAREIALLAKLVEYEEPGFRRLVLETRQKLPYATSLGAEERLGAIDVKWLNVDTWLVIQRASSALTWRNIAAAFDRRLDPSGKLVAALPGTDINLPVLLRTFQVAALVCLCTLALGFPTAAVITSASPRISNMLLMLVLLPFWTSALVRTTAWIVLLQNRGLVNGTLMSLGVIAEPLPLMFSRFGVIVVMTHVLLPFMVLPICNSMRAVSPRYVQAGLSLGASPLYTYFRIYLPMIKAGVINGCTLVFISAIGYYITPALVGGASDQLISYLIAFHTNTSLNWGMASALSILLLFSMVLLYLFLRVLVGPLNFKMDGLR